MARLNTFKIQFHSFEIGVHEMVFDVNDSFFVFFEDSEVSRGQVEISVIMTKSERQMQFDLHLSGEVEVVCDRCLDPFSQPIDSRFTMVGKFGDGNSEDELDVIWIPRGDHELDLAGYIYEYIILSLPIKKVHPDNEDGQSACNPDMLDKLSEIVLIVDE
ncbi:MAG: DUF177 domain-containing protein [Bacteroidales bacterium]|nr:DUF177 domain-containing protein [Bacteroidales bacterium]